MKLLCSRNQLQASVSTVLKAVSSKTTLPILECILIEARNETIKMTANDMELGIETIVEGTIEEEGQIAIDARLFSEIVRKLPDNDITLETDENEKATITCENSVFHISGREGNDFPSLPDIQREKSIAISQFSLKEAIRQTIFSISDNENNRLMTGELFEVNDGIFTVTSLDGHRISIRNMELKKNYEHVKVVVPGKTLSDLNKILPGEAEEDVIITFSDKHILFEFDQTKVVSRLLEGEYYKIKQMLSSDYETKIVINKKDFISSMERAILLIRESDKRPIILNMTDGKMELKVNTMIGSMNEDLAIQKEGKDILIGFNPRFLLDALRVIDDEEITIYLVNPKAPCFIRDEEESYIYLILPVNFTSY